MLLTRIGRPALIVAGLALLVGGVARAGAAPLKVAGSTTVNPVVVDAAKTLRRSSDLDILIDTLGGSSGGIAALSDGRAQVAMASRPITDRDRERFPNVDFHSTLIGFDALALVVSRDVWESGVRSLSADEMRGIYEGRIRNWRELGGLDRRIAFFNKEPGRGTWEVFARWLYGGADAAPLVSFLEVGSNEEARQKISGTRGALTQLSAAWADGESVFALEIETPTGELVAASVENAKSGRYPISRPLLLITDGPAKGDATRLIDFVLGETGRDIVRRHGYVPPADGVAAARSTSGEQTASASLGGASR